MASSPAALTTLEEATRRILTQPAGELITEHELHAGMYARTIRVVAGSVFASVLVKIPTLLIVSGKMSIFDGEGGQVVVSGYAVLPAEAMRKRVYIAHDDTSMTMVFATQANTVDDAEREFTDEFEQLMSRRGVGEEESACQE